MITVHHLNNSRSHRVLWLLEELNEPYEIVHYKRDAKTRTAPPELKKIHPLGKSPVISDGERVVAESGAIIEYLARTRKKSNLWPAENAPQWVEHMHWLHFAEGSAMLPFLLALYAGMLGQASAPLQPRIESEIANHLSYMEGALGDKNYFTGDDLMAADIQLSYVLEVADISKRLEPYPNLQKLIARMRARPAYQRAVEKGGPLELLRR